MESPQKVRSLLSRGQPLAAPGHQLARLDALPLDADFGRSLRAAGHEGVQRASLEIFQINLGKLCNMSCRHCHVDAGPDRTEQMDDATFDALQSAMARSGAHTVDITGGAPELHPRFRELVQTAAGQGMHVIDRCNLTVLLLAQHADLPSFFAEHGVEVVASLPHWRRPNTDAQRGDGTYERSIEALRRLNAAGYGQGDPKRRLTLMHNPAGAFLPAAQAAMEREWREGLSRQHGVSFDRLIALNNMPIARFLEWLEESGNLQGYMETLVRAFNPAAIGGLMCRNTLSIGYDGQLYDCDFNQMLELPIPGLSLSNLTPEALRERPVRTARHCYGCTAGAGSSCGGATAG